MRGSDDDQIWSYGGAGLGRAAWSGRRGRPGPIRIRSQADCGRRRSFGASRSEFRTRGTTRAPQLRMAGGRQSRLRGSARIPIR